MSSTVMGENKKPGFGLMRLPRLEAISRGDMRSA